MIRAILLGVLWTCLTNGQLHDQFRGPWSMVFKVPAGKTVSGFNSIVEFYQASGSLNSNSNAAKTDFSTSSAVYKSDILDEWNTKQSISAVRLSVFKDNKEVHYVVFDAFGKGKNNWFDCNNVIDSSWTDLKTSSKNYCSLEGTGAASGRTFFISHVYGGCPGDVGWLMLKDYAATSGCTEWDSVSSPAMPYIMYAESPNMVPWSASKSYADALVISVLDWTMVFKGVQGAPPTGGSLMELWTSNLTENAQDESVRTVTKTPDMSFKSSMVENWNDLLIEQVKYSFFNGGAEVAYFTFNGRNTNKNTWFSSANVMFSKYTDATAAKSSCSVEGDGTRRFAAIKTGGACNAQEAWMEVMDEAGASKPCSFDQNVQTRPYFLYSAGTTAALCENGGAWYSSALPVAEAMAIFIKGWVPVLKLAEHMPVTPATGIYDMWTGTYTINEYDPNARLYTAGSNTFKSSIVDNWNQYYISAVRLSMYKNAQEHKYMVFDAHGSDKNSWFDCKRILYSSWNDINRDTTTLYCGIEGHASINRRFFLQRNYGGCSVDQGWFVIIEGTACPWEHRTQRPYILYSKLAGAEKEDEMEFGEVFAISVSMDLCNPNPCQNGGTCYSRSAKYECACPSPWTGVACTDVDGGWSAWSAWGGCSVTCGGGNDTRTRSCDNPAPVGYGATCSGSATEIRDCNTQTCPIDGQWGAWGVFGVCTKTCNNGTQSRSRSCDNPPAQHGGADCVGDASEFSSCNPQECPTVAPGVNAQACPSGFFQCGSATNLQCVDDTAVCDCKADCSDNYDESESNGRCPTGHVDQCVAKAGAGSLVGSIVFVAFAVLWSL